MNVYLYEAIFREMVATFKNLDAEYFQERGDNLAKKRNSSTRCSGWLGEP